ncbi:putative ABC transport system ATP-binding protein [Anaerotaenia torta]|uniref:ABC transporter ATP-binding protein n=1 Tax=Anaerotaenia torta TaxID=433293 RepID=UPI003D235EC1
MEYMIKTAGVNRYFRIPNNETLHVLKDINMEIPKGKLTILKGRSGSGKTTLLNILGALDSASSGAVWLEDLNLSELGERKRCKLRRRKIGFIFQSVALIPTMTAFENVEYMLRLAGVKTNRKERVIECLKMVGLGQRMYHMPQELSGGEQQRTAIARAIAHKPLIIYADEPTAELDTNTALQIMKIFKSLTEKEGITVVMTTHDTGLMEIGDRVYELEDGGFVE